MGASLTASKMAHRKIRSLSAHCRALVETDFLNRSLQIHRRAQLSFTADHGELLYRNDGFIEEVSTTPIDPLVAELEHFLHCLRGGEQPAVDGPQASQRADARGPDRAVRGSAPLCMTLVHSRSRPVPSASSLSAQAICQRRQPAKRGRSHRGFDLLG